MKINFSLLLLILSATCFCQPKEITYYFDANLKIVKKSAAVAKGIGTEINGLLEVKMYSKKDNHLVLVAHYTDESLAEMTGPFTSFYGDGTVENQANYVRGQPSGLWVKWGINNKITDSIWYSNGLPDSSVWYDYNNTNHLNQIIRKNFKDSSQVKIRFDDTGKQLPPDISDTIRREDKIVVLNPDEEAEFPGGDSAMNNYLQYIFDSNRPDLLTYGTSGSCRARFTVDKTGKAANVVVTYCDNEMFGGIFRGAIAGILWLPATKNGVPVKSIKEVSTVYYPSLGLKLGTNPDKCFFDTRLALLPKDDNKYFGIIRREDNRVKLTVHYEPMGNVLFEMPFTDSSMEIPDGSFASFNWDGSQKMGGQFVLGRKHGLWLRWNADGRIIDSSTYNLGDKISETLVGYQQDGSLMSLVIIDFAGRTVRNVFFDDNSVTEDKTISLDAPQNDTLASTKLQVEAQFPGGEGAWYTYLYQYIQKNAGNIFISGTCIVRFMVDTSGKVSNVEALTLQGSSLSRILVKAIKNGPNWIPAMQNGRKVNSYKVQPFTVNRYRKF